MTIDTEALEPNAGIRCQKNNPVRSLTSRHVSMRTKDGILSSFSLVALVGCVHTSPLYVRNTPPTRRAPASALREPMADSDSARLERTGFFQRQSSGWD